MGRHFNNIDSVRASPGSTLSVYIIWNYKIPIDNPIFRIMSITVAKGQFHQLYLKAQDTVVVFSMRFFFNTAVFFNGRRYQQTRYPTSLIMGHYVMNHYGSD